MVARILSRKVTRSWHDHPELAAWSSVHVYCVLPSLSFVPAFISLLIFTYIPHTCIPHSIVRIEDNIASRLKGIFFFANLGISHALLPRMASDYTCIYPVSANPNIELSNPLGHINYHVVPGSYARIGARPHLQSLSFAWPMAALSEKFHMELLIVRVCLPAHLPTLNLPALNFQFTLLRLQFVVHV